MTLEMYGCEECYEAGTDCLSVKIGEAVADAKSHNSRVVCVEFEYADQTIAPEHDYRTRCNDCGKLTEDDTDSGDPMCNCSDTSD